jgi:hypothetical protein
MVVTTVCRNIMFCSYEFALLNIVIVLFVSNVVFMEISRRYYLRSDPRIRKHRTTFSHLGELAPGIYVPVPHIARGPGSSVGIATDYMLDGPGIESRWG